MSAIRLLLRPKSVAAGWAALARCNGNVTAPALRPLPPYCVSSAVGTRHMSGFPFNRADATTSANTESRDLVATCAQSGMIQDSKLDKEHHFSLLQCETEKLRSDIEKMRSELRRIHDELAKQSAQTTYLTTKHDQEIDELRFRLAIVTLFVLAFVIVPGVIDILMFIVPDFAGMLLLMFFIFAISDILM